MDMSCATTDALLRGRRAVVRQPIDIGCEQPYLIVAEPLQMRGHAVAAPTGDGLRDFVPRSAPEPDLVGEIRSADRLVPLAVGSVAGHAVRHERLLASLRGGRRR